MAPPIATDLASSVSAQAHELHRAARAERAKVKMTMLEQPVFKSKIEEREYLKGRLAAAFRIFGKFGYDEGRMRIMKTLIFVKTDKSLV